MYEWDDSVAAEKYRIEQAKYHIRHITIVIKGQDEPLRAYHSIEVQIEDGMGRRYSPLRDVMRSSDASHFVVKQAFAELQAWKRKYATYSKVFGVVFKAIDKVKVK